jgi:hypothetical protein
LGGVDTGCVISGKILKDGVLVGRCGDGVESGHGVFSKVVDEVRV